MTVPGDFIANLVSRCVLQLPICKLGETYLPSGAPPPGMSYFSNLFFFLLYFDMKLCTPTQEAGVLNPLLFSHLGLAAAFLLKMSLGSVEQRRWPSSPAACPA